MSDTADLIVRARAAVRSGARNHDLLTALADALEAAEARIAELEAEHRVSTDASLVPDCNCGWGGVHDPDNPRCEANR